MHNNCAVVAGVAVLIGGVFTCTEGPLSLPWISKAGLLADGDTNNDTFCVSRSQPSIQPYEGETAIIPTSQGSKLRPRQGQPLTQSPTASLNVN